MKARFALLHLFALALFFCVVTAAHASTPDGESRTAPVPAAEDRVHETDARPDDAATSRARALRTEMNDALAAAREAEENRVSALVARLEGATPEAQRTIQDEIVAAKREGWIAFLVIQADFARRAGADAAATEIEARIEALRDPVAPATPRPATERRTAPENGTER